jgi:RNA polymerase sigma-54 factor
MLLEIVNDENSANPLSDEAIVETLVKRGVKISRRTVAKYRQELGIPSVHGPQEILDNGLTPDMGRFGKLLC